MPLKSEPKIHIVYAHPYPSRSNSTRGLLEVFQLRSDVSIHSLYEMYPDGNIDVAAEQAALLAAPHIVWLAPVYWYNLPGLMKLWIDQVLTRGWAYGAGATALRNKTCWWIATTGGDEGSYSATGMHQRPFSDFIAPVEQTARFCGMDWQPPLIVHGAPGLDPERREAMRAELAHRIAGLLAEQGAP
ncbi:MAG: NAD(P)H-dependent oxidoreductase [Pseudomonadota bacterium]